MCARHWQRFHTSCWWWPWCCSCERVGIPAVIGYADGAGLDIEIELLGARVGAAGEAPPQGWGIPAPAGAPVERVALAHLQRFAEAAVGAMGGEIAPLPQAPETGDGTGEVAEGETDDTSGTDAPDVTPTVVTPSNHAGSMSSA